MKRVVPVALCAALLGGCGPQSGGQTQRRPGPAAGQQPAGPAPAANAPGPQPDPGQCNDRGQREVELQAHWDSENKRTPRVMWTHNGVTTPATNLSSQQAGPGRLYAGEWSTLVTAQCHDTLSVAMEAAPGQQNGICAIVDLGQGPVKTGKNCRAEYVVP